MRQRTFIALLALALVPAPAAAVGVGLGVYGGPSFPIVQDNAGNGGQFGIRVPVNVIPLLSAEPFFAKSSLGDKEETFGGVTYKRSGPDVTTFGLNAILNFGGPFQFYPFVGIGSSKIEQSGAEDLTETSYDFGLGFGISPIPKLSIQLRGEFSAIVTGDTSRKFGNLTAGVSYALFSVP
ncbi:MAG TPA: outer membrane beta-barrel protein [Candidatus Eisenbacteria bacterium]|jgi:opacity protein-like surface antigen